MVKKSISYKTQIINKLNKELKENYDYISRRKLLQLLRNTFKKHRLNSFKYYMKAALNRLVEKKDLIKNRDSFRLSASLRRKLLADKKKKSLDKKKALKANEANDADVKKTKKSKSIKGEKKAVKTKAAAVSNKKTENLQTKARKAVQANSQFLNTMKSKASNNNTNQISSIFAGVTITSGSLFGSSNNAVPLLKNKKNSDYQRRYKALWQYYDNNNINAVIKRADGWYDYDLQASDVVEDEWQRYIVNRGNCDVRAVKSGQWEYMVDFMNWKQTNIVHENHKQRQVRRLDENGKVTQNPYRNL